MKPLLWLSMIFAGVAFGACGRLPDTAIPTATAAPQPTSRPAATRTPLDFPDRVVITSSSLSFLVEDPAATLAELEVLVEEAGGFVSSASSWSDTQTAYSSLSAKVPPAALADLRRAAIELASSVQGNSTYSQDVTSEVQSLRERLALIDESEDRLLEILLSSSDASLAKSYVLIAQLFQQERQNAESQLDNYMESSTLSSFDVTLNGQPISARLVPDGAPTLLLE
jgi:hypothetical protein